MDDFRSAALAMGAISEDTAAAVDRLVTLRQHTRRIACREPNFQPEWTGGDLIEPEGGRVYE